MDDYSIVEYFGPSNGSNCGYCKGSEEGTRATHGMWAHEMTVQVYEAIIDFGWRRSGKYCYKPTLPETCCPQYTIKCDALANTLTRGQRKCLKRFHNIIENGDFKKALERSLSGNRNSSTDASESAKCTRLVDESPETPTNIQKPEKNTQKDKSGKKRFKRYMRKVEKLRNLNWSDDQIEKHFHLKKDAKLLKQKPKEVEDFFRFSDSAKNKFETKLVASADPQTYAEHSKAEFEVYKLYQTTIHKEKEKEISMKQFDRFLVHSPLKYSKLNGNSPVDAGSFHQQYWLNGELIAVGVVDILETCLSSVYFFYNPKFNFLSLGRISALQEIMLTRSIHKSIDTFQYYYMGYYIHSCPKMRYKAEYSASSLLCPETYTWHPVELIKPLLDKSKYSRFADKDTKSAEFAAVKDLWVLKDYTAMPYLIYRQNQEHKSREKDREVIEFCQLVGKRALANDLLLVRN